MSAPIAQWAVQVWLTDQGLVNIAIGEEILSVPASEPSRLVGFLRTIRDNGSNAEVRAAEIRRVSWEAAIRRKGAEERERQAEREAKERKARLRRADKHMAKTEAIALLAELGL